MSHQASRIASEVFIISVLSLSVLSGCQKNNTHSQADQPVEVASQPGAVSTPNRTATLQPNTSQQFVGESAIEKRLAEALPQIPYTTDNLSEFAKQVNQANWQLSDSQNNITIASTATASAPASSLTVVDASQEAASSVSSYRTTLDYSALRDDKVPSTVLSSKDSAVGYAEKNTTGKLDTATIIKIQALLNWHGHGVGAVNGTMNKNVIKAMQIFQKKHNLPITSSMDDATWQALTSDTKLANQPVLINYKLTRQDLITSTEPKTTQFHGAREAVAERFHMSQQLLTKLNPTTPLKAGNTIIVYNPYQPNMTEVTKVVSDKKKNILYAFDAKGELVASYPTTVGSNYTPSPSGNLKVRNRVLNPTYNSDFSSKEKWLPPGPNNPVGRVWIGLSKKGFGIHGSPEPEMISRQKSHGCVRLTNWDALGLYGTIADGAVVIFL